MNLLVINFCIYLLLWIFFYRQRRGLTLFIVVWSGFTMSALMSLFASIYKYYYYPLDFVYDTHSIIPLFLMLITNLIISLPIKKINEKSINYLNVNTDFPFYKYFFGINIVFFFVISIMRTYEVFMIGSIISYADLYEMMNDEDTNEMLRDLVYTSPFLKTISGIGGKYCPIMAPVLMLYLLSKIAKNNSITINNLLGIVVILAPVLLKGIMIASRGSIFFSMFQLFFYFILVYPFLRKKYLQFIYISVLSLLIVFWGVSYAITESRVEARGSNYTAYEDIIIYFGQPMLNACYFQDRIKYHPMGDRLLDLRDNKAMYNLEYKDYWNDKTGGQVQLFKSYYGDLYLEFGLLGAFIFIFIYTFCWDRFVLKKWKNPMYIPFLWIYFHTLIFAVFDFKNISKTIGIWFFFLIIVCIYINYASKRNRNLIIKVQK